MPFQLLANEAKTNNHSIYDYLHYSSFLIAFICTIIFYFALVRCLNLPDSRFDFLTSLTQTNIQQTTVNTNDSKLFACLKSSILNLFLIQYVIFFLYEVDLLLYFYSNFILNLIDLNYIKLFVYTLKLVLFISAFRSIHREQKFASFLKAFMLTLLIYQCLKVFNEFGMLNSTLKDLIKNVAKSYGMKCFILFSKLILLISVFHLAPIELRISSYLKDLMTVDFMIQFVIFLCEVDETS